VILALITHDRGAVEETSFQALTLAHSLAADLGVPLHAAFIGPDESDTIPALGRRGVSVAHHVVHDDLGDYGPGAWGLALAQLVGSIRPEAVVCVGSDRGNEVMAHLGAILDLPMVANCREVTPSGGAWEITRTRWGEASSKRRPRGPLKLLTVSEHAVEATMPGARRPRR
jgi:electron transfer flavoprotein alpha subunit